MDFFKIIIPDHRFHEIVVHFLSQYPQVAVIHCLHAAVALFSEYIHGASKPKLQAQLLNFCAPFWIY